jgi:hypothetical protein
LVKSFGGCNVHPGKLNKLLGRVAGKPAKPLLAVNRMIDGKTRFFQSLYHKGSNLWIIFPILSLPCLQSGISTEYPHLHVESAIEFRVVPGASTVSVWDVRLLCLVFVDAGKGIILSVEREETEKTSPNLRRE